MNDTKNPCNDYLSSAEGGILPMFGVRHNLVHDFPEFANVIHDLKTNNPEFAELVDRYDVMDKKIYGLEQQMLPVSDDYLGKLKKRRLELKDRLYHLLKNHYT